MERMKSCIWMRWALLRLADGRSLGLFGWYAKAHLGHCTQCSATLKALLKQRSMLSEAGQTGLASMTLSKERWDEIERACGPTSSEPPT